MREAASDGARNGEVGVVPAIGSGRFGAPAIWARRAWLIMPVFCAALLAAPSATLPGDDRGLRGFRTPPLSDSLHLGQTFTMPVDGLFAIEVFPAAAGEVTGDVRLELYDLSEIAGDSQVIPVRTAEVRADDLFRSPSYRFEFTPILDSRDRTYRLDLAGSPSRGVAFWATKGARYGGGSLQANGHSRWADLTFRADAPVPSVLARLMTFRRSEPVRAHAVMGTGIVMWMLLGVAVRILRRPYI